VVLLEEERPALSPSFPTDANTELNTTRESESIASPCCCEGGWKACSRTLKIWHLLSLTDEFGGPRSGKPALPGMGSKSRPVGSPLPIPLFHPPVSNAFVKHM
jgi:hypothetical protein